MIKQKIIQIFCILIPQIQRLDWFWTNMLLLLLRVEYPYYKYRTHRLSKLINSQIKIKNSYILIGIYWMEYNNCCNQPIIYSTILYENYHYSTGTDTDNGKFNVSCTYNKLQIYIQYYYTLLHYHIKTSLWSWYSTAMTMIMTILLLLYNTTPIPIIPIPFNLILSNKIELNKIE